MIRLSNLIVSFLLNAAWQILVVTAVASFAALLLRNVSARYRHALWVVTLLLSLVLPLWSLFGITPPNPRPNLEQPTNALRETSSSTTSTVVPGLVDGPVSPSQTSYSFTSILENRHTQLNTGSRWPLILAAVFLLYVLFRIARLIRLWQGTRKLRRGFYESEAPSLPAIASNCRAAFRLKQASVGFSADVSAPITLGAIRPLVILPESFLQETSSDTICSVLGHEMAHIARYDFFLNVVYEFLLLPLSWHPLARLIKRQIDRTRELACDEMVTERLLEPKAHALSLVRVARSLIAPNDQALMLGIFDADILEERIMRLTQNSRRLGARASRALALVMLTILCVSAAAVSTFSFELKAVSTNAIAVAVDAALIDDLSTRSLSQPATNQTKDARVVDAPVLKESQEPRQSVSAQQRAQAACEVGHQGAVDTIPQLIAMLGDDTKIEPIRCWTIGRWSPALSTFKSPSPGEQAAIALASMGSPAFEPLTNALQSSDASVRRNAAWAIGELTNMAPGERTGAVVPLISLLGDSNNWVRMAAARALGELRDKRSAERMTAALLDGDAGVRAISAWALGEMKEERAVQTLCNVLVSDQHFEVRLAAAEALGEIASSNAVTALNQALNDSEPRVRAKARWAISEIEDNDG